MNDGKAGIESGARITSWLAARKQRPLTCSIAVAVLLCCALAHAAVPATDKAPKSGITLFQGATLIDGSGAPPRPDMDVLVEGERILRVLPDSQLDPAVRAKAKAIDLRERFLMPGMIDAHVHLATPPNRRQAEAILRRDLYGGVTAVRDMADDLRAVGELTRASLAGEIPAPDIYYAALMAGPDFFTDERTGQVSVGGVPGHVPWMQAVTKATDLPLAVARAKGTWATAIKLYADLPADLASRITAEAHRQGLLVWAHATPYPSKPSDMVAAGVDAISHACLLIREPDAHVPSWSEPHPNVDLAKFRQGDNPALARLFKEMARRGTILDATLWTYSSDTAGSTTMPPLAPGSCDDTVGGEITRQAYLAHVPIDAGTDFIGDWKDPWPDLFHELDTLAVKAGMPNEAILQSATLVGARAAGQQRDMGSIEPGKLANMVVLARNPLTDLKNLKSVLMTVKRGRVYPRTAFVPLVKNDITDR
ncbi:amidohydrolase family protein [Luteibacter sp. SG786]|uniref:amidohydrolase family protein n=1 Tax=Luteibacter sp. SG786 TaxID=2587130 RepID=UPI001422E9CC|nr:amidohydrolase family protein [Luteibacter sp. SG786]NII54023.1 imidazolonepropionase-like amidohydrolase [Luteibacter sp. SG786]